LSPRLCCFSGFSSAAYIEGWRFDARNGFSVTETAVPFFACLLLGTGILAAAVASEIRGHVEAALHEAEVQHQLKQVEHELQIARSIQRSLLPKVRPQIPGFAVAGWSQSADDTGGDFYDWKRLPDGRWASRVSAKPAMQGHFKTGHSRLGTLDVVPIAALSCKSHF